MRLAAALVCALAAVLAVATPEAAEVTDSADIVDTAGVAGGPPDYDLAESWLARPGMDSPALLLPGGHPVADSAPLPPADAFYIHPTTAMDPGTDNARIDDADALTMARFMLMAQATPFNGIARIYAPRYRQAALHIFDSPGDGVQAPMNLAYGDVRRAFRHYVRHDNHGRPFFIIAHSQGSNHALRLLAEEVANSKLRDLMVAAYVPGMPVPRRLFDRDLAMIPPCAGPLQTGCVAAWGTFAEGYAGFRNWEAINHFWDSAAGRWRSAQGMELVGVNPVSWRVDGVPVPASAHLGAVPFGVIDSNFARIVPQLVAARLDGGYVLVAPVPVPPDLYDDGGTFETGNYHVFDISLFWTDIRANAAARLGSLVPISARPLSPAAESR